MEPGPFIWTEIDKFAAKTAGSTPSHDGLGNLDGRFVLGCMDVQLEDRPRLHVDEAKDTATTNGKIVESAIPATTFAELNELRNSTGNRVSFRCSMDTTLRR